MRTSNNIPVIEHEDIINIFTENLRTKRKEKKYTQEQLAEKLSLSARYISQLERGIAFGSATTITNICKALNITSDFLFYDLIKSNSPIMNDLIDENFLEDYLKLNNYNKVIVNSITKELVKLQKENFEINKQYKKA